MPTFEGYADVDVEVDEFLSSCNNREIKEVINWLVDEGHISYTNNIIPKEKQNLLDGEWNGVMEKLTGLRLQLSNEEIELITQIVNKY